MGSMEPVDIWASGEAYERYVGRWSRLVAQRFVKWLKLPERRDWLDVGCGTGGLSQTILALANPKAVRGVDQSRRYAEFARAQTGAARAEFVVGDARVLPVESGKSDVAVSGLVLNFVPQPGQMVAEMKRAVCKGGTVALYVWDYAGEMQLMRYFWEAASALDHEAYELDEGRRFPTCDPQALHELFDVAGLQHMETRAIDVDTVFKDFGDYWAPFLGGQGPAAGYVMSLDEDRRAALREKLRSSLPAAGDGSIPLVARAWAIRGVK